MRKNLVKFESRGSKKGVFEVCGGAVSCMCEDVKKPSRKLQRSKCSYPLSELHEAYGVFVINTGLG